MLGRRLFYLAVLGFCLVFYCFYKEWFSWLLLMAVAGLPLLGLVLSLPAMCTVKVFLQAPPQVRMGVPARTGLTLQCALPAPPVRCKLRLMNKLTGERFIGKPGELVPTEHCGPVQVWCTHLWIYDYLGLFRIPVKKTPDCVVYVMPKPIMDRKPATDEELPVYNWKPKPGGGYGENHDLRPYRQGDDLRNIHWKMSAKAGDLIYREVLEPVQKEMLICLSLSGTPQELDRKLGRALGMSRQLLEQGTAHQIRCQTQKDVLLLQITDHQSQETALRTLLDSPVTTADIIFRDPDALWQCDIGGEPDES